MSTRTGRLQCALSVALALALGAAALGRARAQDSDADQASPAASASVEVVPLARGRIPRTVMLYGTVQASALTKRTLMAPGAARVDRVLVRLGQSVAPNAPLVRLGPTPATAASYAQARSALPVAEHLLAYARALRAEHLATVQQLEDARKAVTDARAALAALQAQGAGGAATLRAPFRAIVTALSAASGAIVAEGTPLLELARAQSLVLEAGVVPNEARALAPGDAAQVTALGARAAVSGTVLARGAAIDPASGLVPVEIALPAGALFPGETATASVTTGAVEGYLVPHAAVLLDDQGDPYVVQVIAGAAKKVPVSLLGASGDRDGISGDLSPGAPIVLAGNYQLENGMKVRIASPAAQGARSAP